MILRIKNDGVVPVRFEISHYHNIYIYIYVLTCTVATFLLCN